MTVRQIEVGDRAIVACLASPRFARDVLNELMPAVARGLRHAPSDYASCVTSQMRAAFTGSALRRLFGLPDSAFAAMPRSALANRVASEERVARALRRPIKALTTQVGERCVHMLE